MNTGAIPTAENTRRIDAPRKSNGVGRLLAQLPQFEENCNDFQAFGRRKSLAGIASVDQGAV
jgi:hypothetical protein